MSELSAELRAFLADLRQHPLFPQLLKAVERPRLRPFKPVEADQVEKARAQWIFESGQLKQHDAWLGVLTGTDPSETGETLDR